MDFNSETLNIHRSSSVYYVTFPSFEKTRWKSNAFSPASFTVRIYFKNMRISLFFFSP